MFDPYPNGQNRTFRDHGQRPSAMAKRRRSRGRWWSWVAGGALLVVLGVGGHTIAPHATPPSAVLPQASSSAQATPAVAGASFGDLLQRRMAYDDWLAGVTADGAVELSRPQSGEVRRISQVSSAWHGPVSPMVWSPDHSRLAYLTLDPDDAASLTSDRRGTAERLGLSPDTAPADFPYGYVTILDVSSGEQRRTRLEARNTPKSFLWRDDGTLVAVNQALQQYRLGGDVVETIGAVVPDARTNRLYPPLAWDAARATLYYTSVDAGGELASRSLWSLRLPDGTPNAVVRLGQGLSEDVASRLTCDVAVSDDGQRLMLVDEGGPFTFALGTGVQVRALEREGNAWLQGATVSNARWLQPSRVGAEVVDISGNRSWLVWEVATGRIVRFGQGRTGGSWSPDGSRLALAGDGESGRVVVVTPALERPEETVTQALTLPWRSVVWD